MVPAQCGPYVQGICGLILQLLDLSVKTESWSFPCRPLGVPDYNFLGHCNNKGTVFSTVVLHWLPERGQTGKTGLSQQTKPDQQARPVQQTSSGWQTTTGQKISPGQQTRIGH